MARATNTLKKCGKIKILEIYTMPKVNFGYFQKIGWQGVSVLRCNHVVRIHES